MKKTMILIALALALSASAAALAKTATGMVPVTAQIVSGSSVTAYLSGGGQIVTVVDERPVKPTFGEMPVIRVTFPTERSWFLVERVNWDKLHRHLTIDF